MLGLVVLVGVVGAMFSVLSMLSGFGRLLLG